MRLLRSPCRRQTADVPPADGVRRPTVRARGYRALLWGLVATGLSSGCAGAPSSLDPRGLRAASVADLWWLMLGLAAVIYVVVLALGLYAVFHRRSDHPESSPGEPGRLATRLRGSIARISSSTFVLVGGGIIPAIVIVILSGITVRTMAGLAEPLTPPTLTIRITGYQFWWEIRYLDQDQEVVTANEMHIPVGQPVRLEVTSADVIHSFWVPQILGRMDMIPGETKTTWMQADQPGIYRGICTEFCGLQHAHMHFLVIAEPPDQFASWVERERRPAVEPADDFARRGAQVFARAGCINCHTIRSGGSPVGGQIAPDLTHLASRRTLAAGMLTNNRGNLAGWVSNAQAIKPGNLMPAVPMDSESLLALVAYLESLE